MKEFTLKFEWLPVLSATATPYAFPELISKFFKENHSGPAVYRWTVKQAGTLLQVYYGEAENLARRTDGYKRGHPGQKTNARINAFFHSLPKHLSIGLEVLKFEPFSLNGVQLNERSLQKKDVRCFLENALIVTTPDSVELLNKTASLEKKQAKKVVEVIASLSDGERETVLRHIRKGGNQDAT